MSDKKTNNDFKTVFLSINSKYIHTLLAPRYLVANSKLPVEVLETNINIRPQKVLSELYLTKPDVIAISCYIFNISYVKKLLPEIKLLLPNAKIILGGYEAAFDSDNYLPICDYVVKGEADFIFGELLEDIYNKTNRFPKIIEAGTVKDLDQIKSPFTKEYCSEGKTKILYFESSRGCPFSCSYCMSANTKGVRAFSLERVFSDLDKIMKHLPKQIKFVDRTFNYDQKRASKIFEYIIDNFSNLETNFHFEMSPELFDQQMFDVLKRARTGLIQFEIGIQSYNQKTLECVNRKADITKIEDNIKQLRNLNNIHLHLDLIAGLPYEDADSFIAGFDRLYNLRPQCLQLGYLKVLKGSKIFYDSQGIVTFSSPPYEIIKTPYLSYDDILKLKIAEEMLEIFHNSGRFASCMRLLLPKYYSPFWFFYKIGLYKKQVVKKENLSAHGQCSLLYDFVAHTIKTEDKNAFLSQLIDTINKDYLASGNLRKWRRK